MPTRAIKSPDDFTMLNSWLVNMPYPYRVSVTKGADRSGEQNALAFKWYGEIADQMGDREASDVRAHCKLHHGVKMLVTEDLDFREKWQSILMPLSLEQKLALMIEPFDMPVTRQMKVSQMSRYLDAIIQEFQPMGVSLTMPVGKL